MAIMSVKFDQAANNCLVAISICMSIVTLTFDLQNQ